MLQAFVLLVIGLTTSVVVIWYSFVLPAILLYTTPWIVLHIATAHWLLINIVFHYFKAVFTSPGRALQVRPCNCRQQEEPAILIFRLLLHMHHMYVASINLFGLPLKMNGMHRTQFDCLCLDFLSLIIWSLMFWPFYHVHLTQSTTLEQKGFNLWSLSPALCNLPWWKSLQGLCWSAKILQRSSETRIFKRSLRISWGSSIDLLKILAKILAKIFSR